MMPTKPIDRLMFAQGGLCYFCKSPLPKSEASVEHLVASTHGGSNSDENCVACCKAVNALLGSMSLKEKIQVVLNQNGHFKCPNGASSIKVGSQSKTAPASAAVRPSAVPDAVTAKSKDEKFNLVVANLKQRCSAKPRTLKTLTSTVASLFPKGISATELSGLLQRLQSTGKVIVADKKVTYAL